MSTIHLKLIEQPYPYPVPNVQQNKDEDMKIQTNRVPFGQELWHVIAGHINIHGHHESQKQEDEDINIGYLENKVKEESQLTEFKRTLGTKWVIQKTFLILLIV